MGRHLLVLLAGLCACGAYASTNELKTQLEAVKKIDVSAIVQAESNLYPSDSSDHQAQGRVQIAPSYRLNDKYRAGLSATLIQDMSSPERKSALGNAKLSVSRTPVGLNADNTLLLSGGLRLPTNADDHRDKTYNGSLVVEPNLLTRFAPGGFGFTTISGLYLVKNFHTYDRSASGEANLDYQTTAYFGIEKYLTRRLSLTLDGDYSYATTYSGVARTLFDVGQSLTYEMDTFSFTIGHTNGGDALQANGRDYNVKVFDGNTSVVYANMRVIY